MENILQNIQEEELQERIDLIRHKLKFLEKKPVVIGIESLDPLMLVSDPIREMVETAGGVSGPDKAAINWENISSVNPDIIVVMLRGFSIEQTMKEIPLLLQQTGFAELKATKNNQIYIADGSRYFYQQGSAIVDSIEILAEIINPKQFIFGYEGNGWIKFSV